MQKAGYSLIDASGNELERFSGVPEPLALPNGDFVHAVQVGEPYAEWRVVERWIDDQSPGFWYAQTGQTVTFDGTKIIVTVQYEASPSIVPSSVSPRQARLALLGAGLLDRVDAAVKAAGGAAQITWDYATSINRTDQLIATLGQSLGLTDAQIDDLFRQAETL